MAKKSWLDDYMAYRESTSMFGHPSQGDKPKKVKKMGKYSDKIVELEEIAADRLSQILELQAKLQCATNALREVSKQGGPIDLTKVLEAL